MIEIGQPSAKIIADSYNPAGIRITTMEIRAHRFILAEINTHRLFSRNSASSRAIPIKKQIERIQSDLAYPLHWGTNQAGMQAGDPLSEADEALVRKHWKRHARVTIRRARKLEKLGLHKQVTNRLLEPFMWQTIVITSTYWNNFFRQRVHKDAQPEFQAVAKMMQSEYNNSVPNKIEWGQWHLPYTDNSPELADVNPESLPEISAARACRVSYNTQGGHRDPLDDLRLYGDLTVRPDPSEPTHASPLEHPAQATKIDDRKRLTNSHPSWTQLRVLVEDAQGYSPVVPEIYETEEITTTSPNNTAIRGNEPGSMSPGE